MRYAAGTALAAMAVSSTVACPRAAPRSGPDGPNRWEVVIEIPSGSRKKWEHRDGRFVLDRTLPESVGGYPANYGFLPKTRGPDGDPIDVLVPGPPLPRGTRISAVPIDVLDMADEKGPDPKILMVGAGRPAWSAAQRAAVRDFFARYKASDPGAFSRVGDYGGRRRAAEIIEAGRRRAP